ncbi:ATP-binding protein [Streptomyces sp. NPDC057654]|uniref:ATP-binding protein n=1 Tax=Streptomyces sp. NPDC057654 TaxID=3346196 RepID=UPI0036BDAFAE
MATVSSPQPWTYTLDLPHDPRASGVARTTLRAVLFRHTISELVDVAELLTSELVTNAYLHSDGPASLRLHSTGPEDERLRVSVWDTNPDIPTAFRKRVGPPRDCDHGRERESGRGLLLVQMCADSWGSYLLGDELFGKRGKMLWFELEADDSTSPARYRRQSGRESSGR